MSASHPGIHVRPRVARRAAALALLGLALAPALAAPPIPKGHDPERYRALWERSPFAIESKEEIAQAPAPDMAIVGFARSGSDVMVTVVDKRSQKRTALATGEDRDGMSLVELREGDRPESTTAIIRVGAEEKTVPFDPQLLMTGTQPPIAPKPGAPTTSGRAVTQGQPGAPGGPLPAGVQIHVTQNPPQPGQIPPPPIGGQPPGPPPPGMIGGAPPLPPPQTFTPGSSSGRRIRRPIIIPMRPSGTP